MTKADLQKDVQEAGEALGAVLEALDEATAARVALDGWTAGDLLGHLSFWLGVSLERARNVLDGQPVRRLFSGDDTDAQLNSLNERESARRRDWSLARVRAELESNIRELVAVLDRLSDAQLEAQLGEGWPPDSNLAGHIVGNAVEHVREHLPALRAVAGLPDA